MPFQYTFRSDDIPTWDVDTRDLLENRDRELELYSTTIDNSFLNLNASNLTSGTVPSARMTGAYTGITGLGTLTSLTIDGPLSPSVFFGDWNQNNNWSGIRGTFGYLLTGSSGGGDTGIFLRSESATHPVYIGSNNTNTLRVDNTSATVAGTMNATTFSGSGASLTSLPAGQLTGTVASARISGAYTGITQLGTISPSLTVTGGSGTTITATTQTLINGTNNNAGIYLGNQTGSLSTGGIEASWRDALNPSIAIGVTRDGNKTMTIYEYSNFIYAYTNGGLRHQTSVNGLEVFGRVTISTQPAFMAGPAANYTLSNVSTVIMNTLLFNLGSAFNTGTYRFTAPVTGSYYFSYNANVYNMDTGVYWLPAIYKNGAVYMRGGRVLGLGANDSNQTVSGVVRLTAGDYVTAVIECNDPSYNISGGTVWNSFSGILIG